MLGIALSDIQQCEIIAFVSFLTDILSMSYFIFSFCVQIYPLWNQYTDSTYYFLTTLYSPSSVE